MSIGMERLRFERYFWYKIKRLFATGWNVGCKEKDPL